MSVTFLQSSRWSLCYLSQSSISAYETNTPRWSDKFHPHLCTNWCLQIFVLSTYTSRLEHSSVCWSPSQVVCKQVRWPGRLSYDTPVVTGDAHCWIFAEELKNWRFSRKCTEIGLRYRNRIWGITLSSLLQGCKFTENYRIPFRLCWEYGTVPVAFSTMDKVPYPQTLRKGKLKLDFWSNGEDWNFLKYKQCNILS